MSEKPFDPYHVWLGIPPKEQPPNLYRLLGLELYEENTDVIDAAANRQTSYLHEMAAGPNRRQSQELLNEIAAARRRLLDAGRKAKYDEKLRAELAEKEVADQQADASSVPVPLPDPAATQTADAAPAGSAELEAADDDFPEMRRMTNNDATGSHSTTEVAEAAEADAKKRRKSTSVASSLKKKEAARGALKFQAAMGGGCLLLLVIVAWLMMGGGDEDEDSSGTIAGSGSTGGESSGATGTETGSAGDEVETNAVVGVTDPAPEHLVAHWSFNLNDPVLATVSAPAAIAATMTGEPKIVDGGPFESFLQLDGQDDRIDLPATALNAAEGTAAMWMRVEDPADRQAALVQLRAPGGSLLDARLNPDNGVELTAGPKENRFFAGYQVVRGEWFHLAVTWKAGAAATVYLNGQPAGQSKQPASFPRFEGAVAGSSPGSDGKPGFHKVALDDLRFYKKALDDQQIAKLTEGSTLKLAGLKTYQAIEVPSMKTGPDGLVAFYSFEDAARPELEKSGNGEGTNHGGKVATDPVLGKVLDLDGAGKYVEVPRPVSDDFTISFWLKTEMKGPANGPWKNSAGLISADSAGKPAGFGSVVKQGKVVFAVQAPGKNGTKLASSKTTVSDGKWHFVAMTRSNGSGKMQLFVDGNLEVTTNGPKGSRGQSPVIAIGKVRSGKLHFKGQLAAVRIHNQVLPPEKLKALGGPVLVRILDEQKKAVAAALAARIDEFRSTTAGKDQILSEYWRGLTGDQLNQFKDRINQKPGPDNIRFLNALATTPKQSLGDQYGQRVTGYLIPPKTGNYKFDVAFDDHGEFWLSEDGTPEKLKLLASASFDKPASSSGSRQLRANRPYFFQVLHRKNSGDDQFSVKWTVPGTGKSTAISAAHLSATPQFRMFLALTPQTANANANVKLTISPDRSILADGESRDGTYTVDLIPTATEFTGFRLEILTHESHPGDGPGMGALGMFAVSEVELGILEPGSSTPKKIELQDPVSSSGTPRFAADGDEKSTWSVRRRSGEDAKAVSLFLTPKSPVRLNPGARLRLTIRQETNIGRFRFSGTAMEAGPLQAILAKAETPPTQPPKKKLKLLVNLNGKTITDPKTKERWVSSREFKGSATWGHRGGGGLGNRNDQSSPLVNSIQGIQSFHAKVDPGSYVVTLIFADHWVNNPGDRQFTVQIEKPNIGGRIDAIQLAGGKGKPCSLQKVVGVSDGSLDIHFIKAKGEPILNAIRIEQR